MSSFQINTDEQRTSQIGAGSDQEHLPRGQGKAEGPAGAWVIKHTAQVRPSQHRPAQVSAPQIRTRQISVGEVSPGQSRIH